MYAIKMNRRHNLAPKTKRDKIYVDVDECDYTTLENCAKWETREAAQHKVTEPWESVVEVPNDSKLRHRHRDRNRE